MTNQAHPMDEKTTTAVEAVVSTRYENAVKEGALEELAKRHGKAPDKEEFTSNIRYNITGSEKPGLMTDDHKPEINTAKLEYAAQQYKNGAGHVSHDAAQPPAGIPAQQKATSGHSH